MVLIKISCIAIQLFIVGSPFEVHFMVSCYFVHASKLWYVFAIEVCGGLLASGCLAGGRLADDFSPHPKTVRHKVEGTLF